MQANSVSKPTNPPSGYQTTPSSYQASVPVTVYRELAAELQSTQAKLSFFQLQNEQLAKQNQMLLQEFEAIAQATDRVQSILTQSNLPESKLSEVLAGIRASSQINPAPSRSNPQGRPPAAKPRTADKPAPASPRKAAVQQTTNAIQEAISRARQLATESAPQAASGPVLGDTLYYDSSFVAFDAPTSAPNPAPIPKVLPKLEIREEVSTRTLRNEATEEASESTGLSGWVLTLTIIAIVLTSFGAGYLLMRPFVK